MKTDLPKPDALTPRTGLTAHRRPLKALTGIRFFAAAYVVLYHTNIGNSLYDHGYVAAGNVMRGGYLAVPLFFILSGFILAYTYQGQIETTSDHYRFWEARIARIWPVYFVSLLLVSLVSFHAPPLPFSLAVIFMVQAWVPGDPGLAGAWNYVCWTLSAEAFFYLLFPWVQIRLERWTPRTQVVFLTVMLALCIAINSGVHTVGHRETGVLLWIPLPVIHLGEFFTGVTLGNLFLRRIHAIAEGTRTSPLFGSGAWTYASATLIAGLLCLPETPWTSTVVVAFAALVYGLASESTRFSRFLSSPALILGGGISYSMYLMQYPVRLAVTAAATHFGITSRNETLAAILIVLLILSYLLFMGVENPARKVLRRLFAQVQQSAV